MLILVVLLISTLPQPVPRLQKHLKFPFVIGEKPIEDGLRILGAHIDSPRLDVKQNPLYEDSDFAYLDTEVKYFVSNRRL